jgi:dolichol-phosphate mannosyltransferase
MNHVKTAVVIPAFKVSATIENVIRSVPERVDHVIVVDDKCPENSGRIAERLGIDRVTVIYHSQNMGVGGAVISGYQKAMELNCDIVVKMDGDGQMDPAYFASLVAPLEADEADYCKGNRFVDFQALRSMPAIRLFGNNVLSFWVKVFSGYWNIMDPTNGYTAIHVRALRKLRLERIAKGFFFESDMLLNLNLVNAVVVDVAIPAKYDGQNSSLTIGKTLIQFPPKLLSGMLKRLFLRYFIYDFNMASVYILVGIPMILWGIGFGLVEWVDSYANGVPKSTGTIMLAVLPFIVGFEMLLQAVNIDINLVPKRTP